jgi:carboxyl-terminal processing protease
MPRFLRLYGGWLLPIALAGLLAAHNFRTASAGGGSFDASLARLRAVHDLIQERYVKPVGSEAIVDGALHGMMGALDSHCAYFNAKDFQEFIVDTKGEFGGVGIEIDIRDGWLNIITPVEDSPAARAGIRAGDVVLKIDGESAENITLEKAISRIRGKEGTPVVLHVQHCDERGRPEGDPVDIRIVRGIIRIDSVKGVRIADPEAKIGYIRVTAFQDATADAFREAVQKLQGQGMRALVVDLRFNGGGLLDEAVELADLFVDDGVIVFTRGRRPEEQKVYRGKHEGTLPRLPLAVLVNGTSASASEIFAGAIKDHGLGVLIGERTYGKASVQTVIQFKDIVPGATDAGGLKLTTAHYFTPNNVNLNRVEGKKEYGLEPDIEVKMTPAEERAIFGRREGDPATAERPEDRQLARAVAELRRQLGLPAAPAPPGTEPGAKEEKDTRAPKDAKDPPAEKKTP